MADKDEELEVFVAFREQVTKGTKSIQRELAKLEGFADSGFGKVNREAKKTETLLDKVRMGAKRFGSQLVALGKGAVLVGLTAGIVGVIALFKIGTQVSRVFFNVIGKGFRLLIRLARAVVTEFTTISASLDKIAKVSLRLGVASQALRELRFAAQISGVEARTLDMALQRMIRRLGEIAAVGRGEAKPALEALGIPIERFIGLKPEERFEVVADALAGVTDSAERLALGFKFFDAEGTAVLQMLSDGAAGVRRLRGEFMELSGTISDFEFENIQDMNDSVTRLGIAVRGLKERIAVELAPAITKLVTEATNGAVGLRKHLLPEIENIARVAAVAAEFIPDAFRIAFDFAKDDSKTAWRAIKTIAINALAAIGATIIDAMWVTFKITAKVIMAIWDNVIGQHLGAEVVKAINFILRQFAVMAKGIRLAMAAIEAGWIVSWNKIKRTAVLALDFLTPSALKAFNIDLVNVKNLEEAKDFFTEFNRLAEEGGKIVDKNLAKILIPEITPEEMKKSIARALAASAPEVEAFFTRVGARVGMATQDMLKSLRVIPGLKELIDRLEARLDLAKSTVAAEEQVTKELKKQKDTLDAAKAVRSEFAKGFEAGLFGGKTGADEKVIGVFEELNDLFKLGASTAAAAATGVQDVWRNLFLDLTDASLTWQESFQNVLLNLLDLARNLAAELLSAMITREILSAIAPAGEASDIVKGAAEQEAALAAAIIRETSALRVAETIEIGALTAAGTLEVGGTAAGTAFSTAAGGALTGLTTGAALVAVEIKLGATIASSILISAGQIVAEEMIQGAIIAAGILAGSGGGAPKAAMGGVFPGRVVDTMPYHEFATGGIRRNPTMALFAEAGTAEAFVPLPDGRSIPVTVNIEGASPRMATEEGTGRRGGRFTDARRFEINFAPVIHAADSRGVDASLDRGRDALREELLDLLRHDDGVRGEIREA